MGRSVEMCAHWAFFSEPGINRITVKSHFSETQDDRDCQRVNCKILGELFNFDA